MKRVSLDADALLTKLEERYDEMSSAPSAFYKRVEIRKVIRLVEEYLERGDGALIRECIDEAKAIVEDGGPDGEDADHGSMYRALSLLATALT